MAITTTTLGPNSGQIEYDPGSILADIITACENFIATHGWDLFDDNAGPNAKAFRAYDKLEVIYKYVVVDFNNSGYVLLRTYESWDKDNHTGLNLAFSSDDNNSNQKINLSSGGSLFILSNPRWLIMESDILGDWGSLGGHAWCGCIEITRDNKEDIPERGIPPFAWINGAKLVNNLAYMIGFVRLKGGQTGGTAALHTVVSTGWHLGDYDNGIKLADTLPIVKSAWSRKYQAFTLKVGAPFYGDYRGRLYGVKVTNIPDPVEKLELMDSCKVKVNSDYFEDPAGTNVEHWILTENVTKNVRFFIPK